HAQDADAIGALVLLEDRAAGDVLRGRRRVAGHPADRRRVRAQRRDALLGAPQARRGDHFHGTRDLLDVLHAADALLEVLLGHGLGRSRPLDRRRLLLGLAGLRLGAVGRGLAVRGRLVVAARRGRGRLVLVERLALLV